MNGSAAPRVTAVLGPTNTGKTHLAMERMLGHASGMIGFPLRLLARENYERVVKAKGSDAAALVTGEEKIVPKSARYFVCTVESMPLDRPVDFLAVDEIQLAADRERGHIFTDRLLNARGASETMFMGAETASRWIKALVSGVEFIQRPRFSSLSYAGAKKLTRLPPRSAAVAFSAADVYALAELIRRQRGGAAIVMGALSPRTRNAQVELYQSGEVDYLVATDAIGMGLNMDVHHVAFASLRKFDGITPRPLTKAEIAQIAGRAGRHMTDGTFGTTAEAGSMEPEIVEAVENHRFDPLRHLMWRNAELDFRSIRTLQESLQERPPVAGLVRQGSAEDHQALELLAKDPELAELAVGRDRVRLLWEVCQVPDFRKLMADAHIRLLGQLYRHLTEGGRLPEQWVADQVARLDRVDGDIDQLTGRIAHIRTWSYVAHRGDWMTDSRHWQGVTQAIEDKLSEALHNALTQRFVDRRHAVLQRRLRSGHEIEGAVMADDAVVVEGHAVGRLIGFRFQRAEDAKPDEVRALLAAARRILDPVVAARVETLVADPDQGLSLDPKGRVLWREAEIAMLVAGETPLKPGLRLLHDDLLEPRQRRAIEERLKVWLERMVVRRLRPLHLAAQADLPPIPRGIVFQLLETLGALPAERLREPLKALGAEDRAALMKLGLRLGRETVWVGGINDKRQRRLLKLLLAIHRGTDAETDEAALLASGLRRIGGKEIEFGALERIAAQLRRRAKAGAIAADAETAAACRLDIAELEPVMRALGYHPRGRQPAEEGTPRTFAKPRRRHRPEPPKPTAGSPFAALAGIKFERR
ncbi:MAG TPA: helicase-related protein [Candidatus Cybelea sp.]|nr:helicase-related protein [Candidatus Cybelea sp.]